MAANKEAIDEKNRLDYARWLESQGVGQDGKPVNTWLPRYFTMNSNAMQPRRFRRIGSAPAAPTTPTSVAQPAPVTETPEYAGISRFGAM